MSLQETVDGLGQLINGELVTSGETIAVVNPATGEVAAQCPAATTAMVDDAMAAAAAAFPAWSTTPEAQRQAVIRQLADAIEAVYPELETLAAVEKGNAGGAAEGFAAIWFGRHIAEQNLAVDVIEDTPDRQVTVVRAPVGVVTAIAPWNAPMLIIVEKILTALLVGNTVVAKTSPFTPLATLRIAKAWKDIAPPGVVNILAGGDEVGKAMVAHPTARMISFTGSAAAGRSIAATAATTLKNVLLELGGNDAAIVLGDVDVTKVAEGIFASAFLMSGQACALVKRVYAHDSIYDALVAELAELARKKAAELPPLTTKPQFERVKMLVDDAIAHGGKAVTGGAPTGTGYFYPPTIMTGVGPGVRVVDEEQFGPVLPIVPFSDVDWAIEQANGTEYGLCGSIWTADVALGEQLATRLVCGTVWLNQHTEIDPKIPFGGVKSSGIGRNNGQVGTDAYAELQTRIFYKKSDRV
ncbi:Aldehyde Dehydrogenase [Pseudofrankia inefficax]|uniref:Aldehyde Dehydrogenase n=2 Tax=Pseudofrankia inefficax (strain DSM 45817 / CECT 9037 / DDB 130130 / EuI1c) TaxID=298654 RepID=E3JAJ2_PSEI1|nr:Aldehyde Dehydrogenase [Pseudofrankia inefficax]